MKVAAHYWYEHIGSTDRTVARLTAFERFQDFIHVLVERDGMRAISRASTIDHSTISRLSAGNRAPHLDTARKIIDAYMPHEERP